LLYVQIKNLMTNKTTFERFGQQTKNRRTSEMSNSTIKSSLLKNNSQNSSIYG
jgi:hypothetical protein